MEDKIRIMEVKRYIVVDDRLKIVVDEVRTIEEANEIKANWIRKEKELIDRVG